MFGQTFLLFSYWYIKPISLVRFAWLLSKNIWLKTHSIRSAFTYELKLHYIGYEWFIYPNHISIKRVNGKEPILFDFGPGCLSEFIIYPKNHVSHLKLNSNQCSNYFPQRPVYPCLEMLLCHGFNLFFCCLTKCQISLLPPEKGRGNWDIKKGNCSVRKSETYLRLISTYLLLTYLIKTKVVSICTVKYSSHLDGLMDTR